MKVSKKKIVKIIQEMLDEGLSTYQAKHMKNLLADVPNEYRIQIYVGGEPVDIREAYVSDENGEVVITLL